MRNPVRADTGFALICDNVRHALYRAPYVRHLPGDR
jgi:hypothetical protein